MTAEEHLKNMLTILSSDNYEEIVVPLLIAYCQHHGLKDFVLGDKSYAEFLDKEMIRVNEMLKEKKQ